VERISCLFCPIARIAPILEEYEPNKLNFLWGGHLARPVSKVEQFTDELDFRTLISDP
jgi:hypothetical protein